jgi:hypothetical protein
MYNNIDRNPTKIFEILWIFIDCNNVANHQG